MTYAELVTLIEETTENLEATFVSNIPFFVKRAEERIYRFIKLPKLRKVDTSIATVSGTRTLTMPADFLSVDSFTILASGVHVNLIPKEPDFIREAYGTVSYQARPLYYALRDNTTVILGPTPDAIYQTELTYTHKPESIVTAGTSWLGDNAENALLYGSLCESAIFMKSDPDIMQTYDRRFEEAVGVAKILAEGKDRTNEWRNSPPRAPQAA